MKHFCFIFISIITFSFSLHSECSIGADSDGNLLLGYKYNNLSVISSLKASYHKDIDDYIDADDLFEEFFYCTFGIKSGYIFNYSFYSIFPFICIEKQFPIYVRAKGYIDNNNQKEYLRDTYDDYYFSAGLGISSKVSKRVDIGIHLGVKIHPSKIAYITGSNFTSNYIYLNNTLNLFFNL